VSELDESVRVGPAYNPDEQRRRLVGQLVGCDDEHRIFELLAMAPAGQLIQTIVEWVYAELHGPAHGVMRLSYENGKLVGYRIWDRRGWIGRLKLDEVRDAGRKKKGAAAAREMGARAILLAKQYPNGNGRDRRRIIHELLMKEFLDPNAPTHARAHPAYRAARATVLRRLQRAHKELGAPPELRPLI
jgi:hypothetical protein